MRVSLLALYVCSFPQYGVLPFTFLQNIEKNTLLKGTERKLDHSSSIVDDYERSKERLDELIRNKEAIVVKKRQFDHYPTIMKDYERSKEQLDELMGTVEEATIDPGEFSKKQALDKLMESKQFHQSLTSDNIDDYPGEVEWYLHDDNEEVDFEPEFGGGVLPSASFDHISLDEVMETESFRSSLNSE